MTPKSPTSDPDLEAKTTVAAANGYLDTIAGPELDPDPAFDDTYLVEHVTEFGRARWPRGTESATGAERLGSYNVIAPIASGWMGLLYAGEHALLGYRVVIKVLHPSLRGNEEMERRLFSEAVATARISHPGVPVILDYGRDRAGSVYLVMEYIEGDTLAAHRRAGATFSLPQVLEVGAQLASILCAAHARGVLHRRVNPDSIHLGSSESGGLRVKLLDFASAGPHDVVAAGAWFMSPEETFGPSIDERTDVYSLGCVLFELLTGRVPFAGDIDQVIRVRRDLDPPPPRAIRSDIAPALDRLIHRMIARNPADRPSSMTEIEAELRTMATVSPAAARSPARAIGALVAGAVVGVVIGLVLSLL